MLLIGISRAFLPVYVCQGTQSAFFSIRNRGYVVMCYKAIEVKLKHEKCVSAFQSGWSVRLIMWKESLRNSVY